MAIYVCISLVIALYVLLLLPIQMVAGLILISVSMLLGGSPRGDFATILYAAFIYLTPLLLALYIANRNEYLQLSRFNDAQTTGAVILFTIAHLGSASAVYVWSQMSPGGASGLFLIPSLIWMLVFYGLGFATITKRLRRGSTRA